MVQEHAAEHAPIRREELDFRDKGAKRQESEMRIPRPLRTSAQRLATASALAASAFLPLALPHAALAQTNPTLTNVVPESAALVLRAKIVSIDPKTRRVVLQGPSGAEVRVTAGPVVRLELLKPGDAVVVRYYRSVAFGITMPKSSGGAPSPGSSMTEMLATPAETPGGVGLRVTRLSGLVVGIDLAAHSVDLADPSGGRAYTVEVTDPGRIAQLSKLRIGDTITAVVTEAMAASITPAKE